MSEAFRGRSEAMALVLFVVDFDGTIAPRDTVDSLLARFAGPEWVDIEKQWVRGEITSRQCMASQIALVQGEQEALEAFLKAVQIDPGFADFVHYVRPFADLAVVSDGIDLPIRHALRHLDVPMPVYANRLGFRQGGLEIGFPYSDSGCEVGSGVCKCAVARAVNGDRGLSTILIGDGRSDLCVARRADFVFAKGSLIDYCKAENIVHTPFETFADVLSVVRQWNEPAGELPLMESAWRLAQS
jgi:2-hydroxy-3-keto-5-methylthiopentenyl-1-phosphate phosphatase